MDQTSTSAGKQYVTALFDSQTDANKAVERIVAEGIPREDVQMMAGQERTGDASTEPAHETGFLDKLKGFFMPDEDRQTYAEGLSRGGYLVALHTKPANHDRVVDILNDDGSVDTEARPDSPDQQRAMADRGSSHGNGGAIPIAQEELRVGKRETSGGQIRAKSHTVETPVEEDVTLRDETVSVDTQSVDRPASESKDDLFRERTIGAQEHHEEAVVDKTARVKEEVVIGKDVDHRTETVKDNVRHTEVEVDDDRAPSSPRKSTV